MKELHITTNPTGDVQVEVVDTARGESIVHGSGPTVGDAAGWVLHHLRRHYDETTTLFARLGIVPTSVELLKPRKPT